MVDDSKGKWMKDVDVAKALNITPQAVHNIKARFIDSTSDQNEETANAEAVLEITYFLVQSMISNRINE